jgi:hypothetical protein
LNTVLRRMYSVSVFWINCQHCSMPWERSIVRRAGTGTPPRDGVCRLNPILLLELRQYGKALGRSHDGDVAGIIADPIGKALFSGPCNDPPSSPSRAGSSQSSLRNSKSSSAQLMRVKPFVGNTCPKNPSFPIGIRGADGAAFAEEALSYSAFVVKVSEVEMIDFTEELFGSSLPKK